MRNGYLNAEELAQLQRCRETLDKLQAKIPPEFHVQESTAEYSTWHCLITARNRCGEILDWQTRLQRNKPKD